MDLEISHYLVAHFSKKVDGHVALEEIYRLGV